MSRSALGSDTLHTVDTFTYSYVIHTVYLCNFSKHNLYIEKILTNLHLYVFMSIVKFIKYIFYVFL